MNIKFAAAFLAASAGLAGSAMADVTIGFEAAEGYAQGNIIGQNGWLGAQAAQQVVNGLNAGNGSANALRLSGGPQPNGTFGTALTPNAGGELWSSISVDTRIDDDSGANYLIRGTFFNPLNNTTTLVFRVEFDYQGNIYSQDPSSGLFLNTNTAWAQNAWRTVNVSITDGPLTSTLQVYYNNVLIQTHTGLPLGIRVNNLLFAHDNYQNTGNGTFSGGADPAGYFDNISAVVPAPGTAALVGLAALGASRRRR